jgi:excisionase family DNA binding protein
MTMSEQLLRVPEVARRLGVDGTTVYGLIDRNELAAGKGADGLVYVTESALREYERHQAASAR